MLLRILNLFVGCGLALGLCVLAAGCNGESKITRANADKVTIGMSEKEVSQLLGSSSESAEIETPDVGSFPGLTIASDIKLPRKVRQSVWKDGNKVILVHFADGKVVARSFGEGGTSRVASSEPTVGASQAAENRLAQLERRLAETERTLKARPQTADLEKRIAELERGQTPKFDSRATTLEKRVAELERLVKKKLSANGLVKMEGTARVPSHGEAQVYFGVKYIVPPNLIVSATGGSSGYTITEQKVDHFKVKNTSSLATYLKWSAEGQPTQEKVSEGDLK